jgi:serine/threonine-protein kinase RsbW
LEAEHNEVSPSREVAEIRLPNRLRYLSILAEFVGGVCRSHEVPEEDLEDILLAVDEASSNIIKYAYEVGSTNYFLVRISCDRKLLQVDLLDRGKKFNPLEAPSLDGKDVTAAGKGKDLSLGIHIMKKVVDDVRYRYSPNQGNHLILVKKISQSKRSSL